MKRRPDDKPAADMTRTERVVMVCAVIVALACLAALALLPAAPPEPGFGRKVTAPLQEDDPGWDCHVDGNGICGTP